MPREWILANFLCCGYTAENICHNEAYRQVSDPIMLPLRKSEWLNTRNRWYTEGRIGFSSSQQTLVINTSPKKSNDFCMMGMFGIPLHCVSLLSAWIPLSQILLSQYISCRAFTSLFTTYPPSAVLSLIICSAFSTLLDMLLSPSLFLCCLVFFLCIRFLPSTGVG